MNHRTEPTKEQNEAAIRALKREMRGKPAEVLKDARVGLNASGAPLGYYSVTLGYYSVTAYVGTRAVNVADFWFRTDGKHSESESWLQQDTARILAEELADRINEQQ